MAPATLWKAVRPPDFGLKHVGEVDDMHAAAVLLVKAQGVALPAARGHLGLGGQLRRRGHVGRDVEPLGACSTPGGTHAVKASMARRLASRRTRVLVMARAGGGPQGTAGPDDLTGAVPADDTGPPCRTAGDGEGKGLAQPRCCGSVTGAPGQVGLQTQPASVERIVVHHDDVREVGDAGGGDHGASPTHAGVCLASFIGLMHP